MKKTPAEKAWEVAMREAYMREHMSPEDLDERSEADRETERNAEEELEAQRAGSSLVAEDELVEWGGLDISEELPGHVVSDLSAISEELRVDVVGLVSDALSVKIEDDVAVDRNKCRASHAEYLVARLMRDRGKPAGVGAYAEDVLASLLRVYPELRPAGEKDPFEGIA